jgi:hypothetical protein
MKRGNQSQHTWCSRHPLPHLWCDCGALHLQHVLLKHKVLTPRLVHSSSSSSNNRQGLYYLQQAP